MKTTPQSVALALSCFVAGFLACYFLMRQPLSKRSPVLAVGISTYPPVVKALLPTVSTQEIRIEASPRYQWPDGSMQRTLPPDMRPGYYDLIDTRAPTEAEFGKRSDQIENATGH